MNSYDTQTGETYRILADIRFKLLAFVPSLTGVAVALITEQPRTEPVFVLGLPGFV
ncbi:MAG: hypothetical protein KJ064_03585 [Anaerolineae bacterium]|nr:hypothetical protein [Anaerolineae bacterium]